MKTLFLIGYMGSGKTSYGRQIAADLGLPFVDLDEYIEEQEGMKIPEIFSKFGEGRFREIESRLLRKLGGRGDLVVATGGGTPCRQDNIDYMNATGTTLWLDASVASIASWLIADRSSRPLVADVPDDELPSFIEGHLISRIPFYSQARFRLRPS